MRHRARRPVLDRLRSLVAAHRGAAVVVAVLTSLAVTGVALTASPAGPGSERTGSSVVGGDAPSYPPDQTPGSTASATPDAEETTRARAGQDASPSALASTRARAQVSRSSDRALPTDEAADRTPSAAPPEPSATEPAAESPAADAPQTSATTRTANAGRWVIGVSADAEATFECSLDGGAFQPCGSSVSYDDLDEGTHSFAARATDADGDTDPSPATLTAEIESRGQG